MRHAAPQTQTRHWSRAGLACLVVLLLWPASASADIGRCVEVSDLAERGIASFLASSETSSSELSSTEFASTEPVEETPASTEPDTAAPCGDDPSADPSSNFCFEEAEGQISTLPALLAQWRGEQVANAVVDSLVDTIDEDQEELLAEFTVLPEPQPDEDSASCSDRPDQCRALPPLPPTLVVDASAGAAQYETLQHPDLPTRLSTDDKSAWAKLRVRPNAGHLDPPDQPPRA